MYTIAFYFCSKLPSYNTLGSPKDILRTNSSKLISAVSGNLMKITNDLYAEGLVILETKDEMLLMGVMTEYDKATKLMTAVQQQLESSLKPAQYLRDICRVLANQQHQTLTDIATIMLHQLGKSVSDCVLTIPPVCLHDYHILAAKVIVH